MWIGIHDQTNEEEFIYESSGQTITYSNWNPNEPNNAGNTEDCGQLVVSTAGKWNDNDCSKKFAFVCENKGNIHIRNTNPKIKN